MPKPGSPWYYRPKERSSTYCVCCGSRELKSSPAILMPFIAHRAFGWEPVKIDESWELQTIESGNAYTICKSLFCASCEFLFLDIRFSKIELHRIYHDYRGIEYSTLRNKYEPGYSERNKYLNNTITYKSEIELFLLPYLTQPLKILDWGGDTGKNTPFNHNKNELEIYDISKKKTIGGTTKVSKRKTQTTNYDLVVCSNVLEHTPYPMDLMLDLKKAMSKDTVLYIEVPFESIFLKHKKDPQLYKKHWHEHINFFSKKSLYSLIENSDLTILSEAIQSITTVDKTASIYQFACKLK